MHTTRLIHQTPQRLRYVSAALKHINAHALSADLKKIEGVNEVRINAKIGSVVFEGELNAEALLKHLQELDISAYQICDASINACFNDHDEKPSIKGIVRSGMALAFQPFIPQPNIKLAVSTLASIPLLKEGVVELFSEGLTSKVLEAMAVGVSLARRDYTAANSTNVMLEIGEYIEETTGH